jgi:predicted AAA+ superfamily ATPase
MASEHLWTLKEPSTTPRAIVLVCHEGSVHRTPTKWIDAMLSHRNVLVKNRGIHSKRVVRCPQGGVLSPLIWNMLVDQLLRRLNEAHIWAQRFADEVAILVNGLNTVWDLIQTAMNIVQNWCREKGLSVNVHKTTTVLFTNKGLIFGQEIELKKEVKHLGVIL